MRRPVYLDNAATTPMTESVVDAMAPYMRSTFGNPSSTHSFGREARAALDQARRTVADLFSVEPAGVVFTSGGTEADNLAVVGGAIAARRAGRNLTVATSTIEHKAVLASGEAAERMGGDRIAISIDRSGQVDPASLDSALAEKPGVVSVMWVNNEMGAVQDIATIADRCASAGIPLHTDAVQAVGKVPVAADARWSMLSVSAHKIGGPKGCGALILKDTDLVAPLMRGGGQQRGLRSGTESVANAAGLARALTEAMESAEHHAAAMLDLRERLETGVLELIDDVTVNGAEGNRAPHISNISFPGTDSESLLMHLDLAGVACSAGSACTSGTVEPSYVLKAMGRDDEAATSALRFSFSPETTEADVDAALEVLPGVVEKVRSLRAALGR